MQIIRFYSRLLSSFALSLLIISNQASAQSDKAMTEFSPVKANVSQSQAKIKQMCRELSRKLRTVKYKGCMELGLKIAEPASVNGRILTFREYLPQEGQPTSSFPKGRILLLSGIHGDEYSSISITYLWMQSMMEYANQTGHHWLFLPLINPDGLFDNKPSTRTNARGVDLNRNFPSPDWNQLAISYWEQYYRKNKRRYPGPSAASEPETQWVVETIERFKPDAIISVHAPYGLLDYDGPEHVTPDNIGQLKHKELGTFPGSLGRYAGEYLNIPVLTLELHSAGSMPTTREIFKMWQDIERWSQAKIEHKEEDF